MSPGFPGAIYKGFKTLDEAQEYLDGQESKKSKCYQDEEELIAHLTPEDDDIEKCKELGKKLAES